MGWALACVVLVILLIALVFIVVRRRVVTGGAPRRHKPDTHIVVDTLNLTHHLNSTSASRYIKLDDVIRTIDETAPVLRKRYGDRVMYVTKDRETELNAPDVRVKYSDAAKRNGVYVFVVERYEPAGARQVSHAARGRDDFMLAVLAAQYKCPVLSNDKFRDFDAFRSDVEPFHVYEFAYWRALPERLFIRPASPAYRRIRRPFTVGYAAIGL
ncbi:MAG: hypothetical protein KGL39_26820 [Patescibacteria group bacterium]|nr:hypothetical protein [Patescibacteria group bacterium]